MNEVVIESPRYGVWGSKMQLTVALLISKAKYKGATIAACEAILAERLLMDLNESVDKSIRIYCDKLISIET